MTIKKHAVLISGKQGSGKTTLSNNIAQSLGFTQLKLAGRLYQMHDAVMSLLPKEHQSVLDKSLLQVLGTEWGRNNLSETVWIDALVEEISDTHDGQNIVIDDVRFENEVTDLGTKLKQMGYSVLFIRLDAPEEVRKERCEQWRENSNHSSETSLDNYSDFHLRIRTDLLSAGTVLGITNQVLGLAGETPATALVLKEGSRYTLRNGTITGGLVPSGNARYPWVSDSNYWTDKGHFWSCGQKDIRDIVAEYDGY